MSEVLSFPRVQSEFELACLEEESWEAAEEIVNRLSYDTEGEGAALLESIQAYVYWRKLSARRWLGMFEITFKECPDA